jgi:bifunctional enzyme CysN/CysC
VLITGLTGSGKSAIAKAVERMLFDGGRAVTVIEGETLRRGINNDLGYTVEDRSENLRRSAHIAKYMNEAGLIVISAFMAPSESVRLNVANLIGEDRFFVVHATASEATRRARDTKGHYADADSGKLANYPGVSAPYEAPDKPSLTVNIDDMSIQQAAASIVELLRENKIIR